MATSEQPQGDVIAEVLQDHEEIKALFAQVEGASGESRVEAWQALLRKLAVHEVAEEMVVHPLGRGADGGASIVDQRLEEETEAQKVLIKMESLDPNTSEFDTMLAELKTSVLAHANAEESQEHPLIRQAVDESKLQRLAAVYRTAEATAPTHPHPSGPRSATGNMLVGPLVSVIDHARDAIRGALEKSE
jgi:hemerythrin superfamily protein